MDHIPFTRKFSAPTMAKLAKAIDKARLEIAEREIGSTRGIYKTIQVQTTVLANPEPGESGFIALASFSITR